MPLILIAVSVAVTLAFTYAILRIRHWRDKWWDQWSVYTETLDRAMQAEAEAARATTELTFLKNTFAQLLSRPVQALLTEDQVQFLSSSIGQIVVASMKSPDRLN